MVQKQTSFVHLSGITLMLLQTLWCGGVWIIGYLVNPVLEQAGGEWSAVTTLLNQVVVALALACTAIVFFSVWPSGESRRCVMLMRNCWSHQWLPRRLV